MGDIYSLKTKPNPEEQTKYAILLKLGIHMCFLHPVGKNLGVHIFFLFL